MSINFIDDAVYKWLDTSDSLSGVHIATIAASGPLTLLASMVVASTGAKVMPFGVTKEAADILNKTLSITLDPNIEGIPIRATAESGSREVDVTETMVISQSDNGKDWLTDNAVPRPREWTVTGYIMSLSGAIDAFFRIKPTIQAQALLLDTYAKSRRPVWFKTMAGQFVQTLITQFKYDLDPTVQNAIPVTVTLREFIPLRATVETVTVEGVSSTPVNAGNVTMTPGA